MYHRVRCVQVSEKDGVGPAPPISFWGRISEGICVRGLNAPTTGCPQRDHRRKRYLNISDSNRSGVRAVSDGDGAADQAGERSKPGRDSSNRLLDGLEVQPTLMVYTMAYTDG